LSEEPRIKTKESGTKIKGFTIYVLTLGSFVLNQIKNKLAPTMLITAPITC